MIDVKVRVHPDMPFHTHVKARKSEIELNEFAADVEENQMINPDEAVDRKGREFNVGQRVDYFAPRRTLHKRVGKILKIDGGTTNAGYTARVSDEHFKSDSPIQVDGGWVIPLEELVVLPTR